jgi:hypothetical protein
MCVNPVEANLAMISLICNWDCNLETSLGKRTIMSQRAAPSLVLVVESPIKGLASWTPRLPRGFLGFLFGGMVVAFVVGRLFVLLQAGQG